MMEAMGEAYALPLDDLLQVLETARKTCHVRAALPASLLPFASRRGESFVAEVAVAEGKVHSCVIRDQLGRTRLEGEKAFASVRSREQLVWMVQHVQPPEAASLALLLSEVAPPTAFSLVPPPALPWAARPAPVKRRESPEIPANLTRRQRQVWLLIDGKRTVHEIAPLLGARLDELDQELTMLERNGFIIAGDAQKERGRDTL